MNKEYKLNIDPRILELLGPSLYTNKIGRAHV